MDGGMEGTGRREVRGEERGGTGRGEDRRLRNGVKEKQECEALFRNF